MMLLGLQRLWHEWIEMCSSTPARRLLIPNFALLWSPMLLRSMTCSRSQLTKQDPINSFNQTALSLHAVKRNQTLKRIESNRSHCTPLLADFLSNIAEFRAPQYSLTYALRHRPNIVATRHATNSLSNDQPTTKERASPTP